jgi:murein L,D-transpeptidase YafK
MVTLVAWATLSMLQGLAGQVAEPDRTAPCAGKEAALVVRTRNHKLYVCERQRVVTEHQVALGRRGAGKGAEGDLRTPLGEYELGQPRRSIHFGTFIPIGYPTRAQRQVGMSGGDVGIHGPHRAWRWLGGVGTWIDWTRGCIAVASDPEIEALARFTARNPQAHIYLE